MEAETPCACGGRENPDMVRLLATARCVADGCTSVATAFVAYLDRDHHPAPPLRLDPVCRRHQRGLTVLARQLLTRVPWLPPWVVRGADGPALLDWFHDSGLCSRSTVSVAMPPHKPFGSRR